MNNAWNMDWQMVQQHDDLRLFKADQVWAVCPPGVEPGDAASAMTGALWLALEWYYIIKDEMESGFILMD